MATLQDQLEWETKHRDLGRIKLQATIDKADDSGRITDTPLGSGVVRRYLLKVSSEIAHDITVELGEVGRSKQYAVLLRDLDPYVVSLIALSTLLEGTSRRSDEGTKIAGLGIEMGRRIYGEVVLSCFKDLKPDLYETLVSDLHNKMSADLRHRMTIFRMQAEQNGMELPIWTPKHKAQVGLYLIGILERCGLLTIETEWKGNKSFYVVKVTPEVSAVMEDMESRLLLRAGFAAPCLIPPQDWTGEDGVGGYYGDLKVRAVRFFKGTSRQWEIIQSEGVDLTVVLGMLNSHQKVAWKVNPFVLHLTKELLSRGKEIKKSLQCVANYDKPVRPDWLDHCPDVEQESIKRQNEFTAWKAKTRDWHTEVKHVGRVEMRMRLALQAAWECLHLQRFYYPFQLDDRGRMYPVSGPLNPQGSDLQKALLHAADGEHIDSPEALWWFKLGIASKYGIDKLSPEDCVQWTTDNHDNIIRAATDPADSDAFHWWTSADKPLQFIALCDEYRRYIEDPVGFTSRIAVAMDGTCNGLQNYSALLRDPVGGRATNLISAESGVPNDIYGDVAGAATVRLKRTEPSPERSAWREAGFNRSLTKKSVMTQVYGSTFGTCRKSIVEYCYEKDLFEKENRYKFADFAAHLVWDGISDVVDAAGKAMKWCRQSAGAVMAEGAEYITWPAPSGWRVVQIYNKTNEVRVKAHIGKMIRVHLREEGPMSVPDKMRHRNAFPPNFIHSVDSSHMAFVSVDMAKYFDSIGSVYFMHFIHDDFGVLPKHAAKLAVSIREQFVQMHSNYSLEHIRIDYPFLKAPPKQGTLDITCVMDSVNFFR